MARMIAAEVVLMTSAVVDSYEVVVAGGGAAGLSGALTLARARRSVLVIDAGAPRNAPAAAVHGLLGRDGVSPADLLETGRAEVRRYGGRVMTGEVVAASPAPGGFTVTLASGRVVGARRLLVTTGLTDELPGVPGLAQRWGRDVIHCPYCHGWEVRDQVIGVLATGPMAVHQAQLFRQLSADVILFLHTTAALGPDQAEELAARGIKVVPGEVVSLDISDDHLAGVRLWDGRTVACQVLVTAPRMTARAGLLAALGLGPTEHPSGAGEYIAAGPTGLTEVPGVWVAGNVTDLMAQVGAAAAAGVMAAAAINGDLIAEETRLAVAGRARHAAASPDTVRFDQAFWDERYASRDALWSGNPNPYLVSEAGDLPPGTALAGGSGEGADAIWLAQRGWQVTGVDVSAVALERAAGHAAQAGGGIADRIQWQHADLINWDGPAARYDLVSAQYMHLPPGPRDALFRHLAGAVAPGGTLLIAAHHPSDLQTTMPRPQLPGLFYTGDDIATYLDPAGWDIITNAAPGRPATDPEGRPVTLHDTVLRARRRK
jgi:thioredoxin reductase/SAM-dependent methyltransferase